MPCPDYLTQAFLSLFSPNNVSHHFGKSSSSSSSYMPETNGSIFERVEYIPHHSPSASKIFAWYLANRSGGPPPEELTNVPYSKVLTPRTTTPSNIPHTTNDSPFLSEADSQFTDNGNQSHTSPSDLTRNRRLVDFGYMTLQTDDVHSLQSEIVGYTTYSNATIGVYTAAYDPVLKKMGPYRLEAHDGMNVKVARPQGSWVITVCSPDRGGDGEGTIGKSGESIDFCATVTRGEKGHYTDGGTLVYKYGPGWYGLKAVGGKEQHKSRDENEGPDWNEKDREKGQAEKPSVTQVSEEGEASFSEKDRGWCERDERSEDRSTNTPPPSVWRRWFGGGGPRKKCLNPQSDSD